MKPKNNTVYNCPHGKSIDTVLQMGKKNYNVTGRYCKNNCGKYRKRECKKWFP